MANKRNPGALAGATGARLGQADDGIAIPVEEERHRDAECAGNFPETANAQAVSGRLILLELMPSWSASCCCVILRNSRRLRSFSPRCSSRRCAITLTHYTAWSRHSAALNGQDAGANSALHRHQSCREESRLCSGRHGLSGHSDTGFFQPCRRADSWA